MVAKTVLQLKKDLLVIALVSSKLPIFGGDTGLVKLEKIKSKGDTWKVRFSNFYFEDRLRFQFVELFTVSVLLRK